MFLYSYNLIPSQIKQNSMLQTWFTSQRLQNKKKVLHVKFQKRFFFLKRSTIILLEKKESELVKHYIFFLVNGETLYLSDVLGYFYIDSYTTIYTLFFFGKKKFFFFRLSTCFVGLIGSSSKPSPLFYPLWVWICFLLFANETNPLWSIETILFVF